jgi:hypothetical protein
VLVEGQVKGGITASERIELGSNSRVEGSLSADRVVMWEARASTAASTCASGRLRPRWRSTATAWRAGPMTGAWLASAVLPRAGRHPGWMRRGHAQGHQHPDRPIAQLRQQRRSAGDHVQASDTIYVAVLTDGSGSATIGVKFSHLGRVSPSPKEGVLSRRGRHRTPPRLRGRDSAGEYDIEVFFEGQPAGMRKVTVEP